PEHGNLILILSIVAVLTMTLGNVVAAVQSNVKRMMAYSSIAQAGYILVGVIGSLDTGKPDGTSAALFFILVYVITNLGAFSGVIALANLTGGERFDDFKGLWKRAPLLSAGTAFCLLSLAGIPPAAGFFSKVVLFTASWGLGQQWLVIIALLNSIISLVYYGRLIKVMFFDAPAKEGRLATSLSLGTSITLASAALLVLFIIVPVILSLADPAASSLLAFLGSR
ncbi:MAG: NAD(P)H-quinone oxidoreductase subunit 2, partial [Ktedonobacteraceae bacterium]|nr:NAD(P)H-quinone oxidoreductase subunit 2 [Ktedonobacteraceae bacterium]